MPVAIILMILILIREDQSVFLKGTGVTCIRLPCRTAVPQRQPSPVAGWHGDRAGEGAP